MDAVKEIKEEKVMGEEVKKRGRPRKAKEEKKKAEKVEAELVGGKGKNGNLIPLTQRSEEEQREIRAAGGESRCRGGQEEKGVARVHARFSDARRGWPVEAESETYGR